MAKEFEVIVLNPDQPVRIFGDDYMGQLKPTQLYVLPKGSIDNKPSYCFLLDDVSRGRRYVAQISHEMLKKALDSAGVIL